MEMRKATIELFVDEEVPVWFLVSRSDIFTGCSMVGEFKVGGQFAA
jgi:hypothetical protein